MKKLLNKDGIFRLFGSAVTDQAMLSAANFVVGLLLIRYTSDVTYGRFVLVQASILFFVIAQRAWVIDPLTVLAPKRTSERQRDMIGGIKYSQRRCLRLVCVVGLPLPLLGLWAGWLDTEIALLISVTVLASWAAVEREYLRGVLMLYYRPETVLGADMVYVSVLIVGVAFAILLPMYVAIWATVSLMLAALAGMLPASRSLARDPGWRKSDATPYWQEMRPLAIWATVGALLYWILGQGYNYLLVLKLDTTAVAEVNAIRLLLMPAYLLTIGIRALLLPMSVRWVNQSGFGFLIKRLTQFVLALAVLDFIYFALLWASGDWLLVNVLNKDIPDYRFMIAMWALLALINLVREIYLTALLVRKRFKKTARLVAATVTVTLVSMWFTLEAMGASGALVGLAAGELVFLAGVGWLLWRESRIKLSSEGEVSTDINNPGSNN